MQATLADVELSAAQGTHFFGPAHAEALESLREAQVGLASAWGRSGGEEVDEEDEEGREVGKGGNDGKGERGREKGKKEAGKEKTKGKGERERDKERGRRGSGESPGGTFTAERKGLNREGKGDGKGTFEGDEEGGRGAERDILAARKRREANDRYFYRVSKGVLDVVGRLEEVASAMAKVERESREVWSDGEGLEDESSDGKERAASEVTKRVRVPPPA